MFEILLAEDNPGDVLLFREALNSRQLPCNVVVAPDGQKAMTLLGDAAAGPPEWRPHLIVLDVNLPKHNGDTESRAQDSQQLRANRSSRLLGCRCHLIESDAESS